MYTSKKIWQINFGLNLQRVMNEVGYSQRQLSIDTGIAQPTISSYIRGDYSPSITSIIALCQTMEVDYPVLIEADTSWPIIRRNNFFMDPIEEYAWIEDFAMIFRGILRSEDCSQKELAEGTGISQGLISKYTQGRTIPSGYSIMRIAHYLAVNSDYDELVDLGYLNINRM